MVPTDSFKEPLPPALSLEPMISEGGMGMSEHGNLRSTQSAHALRLGGADPTASSIQAQPMGMAISFGAFPVNPNTRHSQSSSANPGPPLTITTQGSTAHHGLSSASHSLLNGIDISMMAGKSSRNVFGTPKKVAGQRDYSRDRTVNGQGKSIMSTMGPPVSTFSDTWARKQFIKDANLKDTSIQKWLSSEENLFSFEEGLFRNTPRWITILRDPGLERNLYNPFVDIITTILNKHLKSVPGIEREVVDMHAKQMKHEEGHHTSPDIVIRGAGPSFERPSKKKPVGYSNIVTFFDIKLQGEIGRIESIEQLAVYARYARYVSPYVQRSQMVLL